MHWRVTSHISQHVSHRMSAPSEHGHDVEHRQDVKRDHNAEHGSNATQGNSSGGHKAPCMGCKAYIEDILRRVRDERARNLVADKKEAFREAARYKEEYERQEEEIRIMKEYREQRDMIFTEQEGLLSHAMETMNELRWKESMWRELYFTEQEDLEIERNVRRRFEELYESAYAPNRSCARLTAGADSSSAEQPAVENPAVEKPPGHSTTLPDEQCADIATSVVALPLVDMNPANDQRPSEASQLDIVTSSARPPGEAALAYSASDLVSCADTMEEAYNALRILGKKNKLSATSALKALSRGPYDGSLLSRALKEQPF